jgi:hypothetical protein
MRNHPFATEGSTTERGKRVVHASTGAKIADRTIARVGDGVVYDDGSEAYVTDGEALQPFTYISRLLLAVG